MAHKHLFTKLLNADDAPHLVDPGEVINMENLRFGTTDNGAIGGLENIKGTLAKAALPITPYRPYTVIGATVDEVDRFIAWFTWQPAYESTPSTSAIWLYDRNTGTNWAVMNSERCPSLNFDPGYPIHSAKIVNGCLYWTDNKSQPCKLNLGAAIKFLNNGQSPIESEWQYTSMLSEADLLLIRIPYPLPPTWVAIHDSTYKINRVKGESFRFAVQYVYWDGEASVLSGWSKATKIPKPDSDNNGYQISLSKDILIPQGVRMVRIVVQYGSTGNVFVAHTLDRKDKTSGGGAYQIDQHNGSGAPIGFTFYNNAIGEGIDNAQAILPYHSVPLRCEALEVSRNRLFLGNILEGYDTPPTTSLSIVPNKQGSDVTEADAIEIVTTTNRVSKMKFWVKTNLSNHWEYGAWGVFLTASQSPWGREGWHAIKSTEKMNIPNTNSLTWGEPPIEVTPADLAFRGPTREYWGEVISPEKDYYQWVYWDDDHYGVWQEDHPEKTITIKKTVYPAGPAMYQAYYFHVEHRSVAAYDTNEPQYRWSTWYAIHMANTTMPGWYLVKSSKDSVIDRVDEDGWFLPEGKPRVPFDNPPSAIPMSDLEYVGVNAYEASQLTKPWDDHIDTYRGFGWNGTFNYAFHEIPGRYITVSDAIGGSSGVPVDMPENGLQYKSGGEYQYGVVFYDEALRKCGVVTNQELRQVISNRGYVFTSRVPTVSWTLNQGSSAEIPLWAKYYAIVRTLNLKTRFFLQGEGTVAYLKKSDTGAYVGTDVLDNSTMAIGLDLSILMESGLGYSYREGDICTLFPASAAPIDLAVKGVDAKYVLLQVKDLGQVDRAARLAFELYTPYAPQSNEPYYEIGELYPIANPGTDNRSYQVTSGSIVGDTPVMMRKAKFGEYPVEAMSADDMYWKVWHTDAGRINLVTATGQAHNKTLVRFSNTFIPGTSTNGLSAFEPLNQELLPIEIGDLQKLQLTSKAQSEGTVMLGIGKTETVSIYIGEAQLSDVAGNSMLIRSVGVIGQVNLLQGSSGTIHPESVAINGGRVFWLDALKGQISSYSANGLFNVSSYKLTRASKLLCQKLVASNAIVPGAIDPYHQEYLLSVPQTESGIPMGNLADYQDRAYPYDFYDGRAKTWVFKINHDRFMGSFRWNADYFASLGEQLFSFKDGTLWEHNSSSTYDNVHGQPMKPMLAFVENGEPDSSMKVFTSLSLEANMKPTFTHIRTEVPYVQSSDLVLPDWETFEGIHYAPIYRDRLTPGSEDYDRNMIFGDEMRGQWAKIMMEFETGGELLQVRMVNVDYVPSGGHRNN